MNAKVVLLAVDGHVLDGKPQGSRTVLLSHIAAFEHILGRSDQLMVYREEARSKVAEVEGVQIRHLPHLPAPVRLLFYWPIQQLLNPARIFLYQYISPPVLLGQSIVVVHDVLPMTHPELFPRLFRLRFKLLTMLSMRRANAIITVSDYSKQAIIKISGDFAKKVIVVPNPPSFSMNEYFSCNEKGGNGDHPNKRMILTVGRIERRRNITMLIDAFRAANVDNCELVIVGKLDLNGEVIPPVPNVRHEQNVSDEDLIALYRSASLFVYPTAAEGFGLPLLDALLFGVPSISSNQTALPEIGSGLAQMFDPTDLNSSATLSAGIANHFGKAPIAAPNLEQRRELADRFSHARVVAGLTASLEIATRSRAQQ